MANSNLKTERTQAIQTLKKQTQTLIQLYNQAFTGQQGISGQNQTIDQILATAMDLQKAAMAIRDYNGQLVVRHQQEQMQARQRKLQQSLAQFTSAMTGMNALLDGPVETASAVADTTDYDAEIALTAPAVTTPDKSSLTTSVAPTTSTAVKTSQAVTDVKSMAESVVPQAEPVLTPTGAPVMNHDSLTAEVGQEAAPKSVQTSATANAVADASQKLAALTASLQANAETEVQPSAKQKSTVETPADPVVAQAVATLSDAEKTRQAEAEFKQHQVDAAARNAHAKQAMAIKWAGDQQFVNRAGEVVASEATAKDVTPIAKTDLGQIDDVLDAEFDKLK